MCVVENKGKFLTKVYWINCWSHRENIQKLYEHMCMQMSIVKDILLNFGIFYLEWYEFNVGVGWGGMGVYMRVGVIFLKFLNGKSKNIACRFKMS